MLKITANTYRNLPGIYIFKNMINGKEYIGESMNIRQRMRRHSISKEQAIHKAILKYGIDNFVVYVEYFPHKTKQELLDIEEEMIRDYKTLTHENGYNVNKNGRIPANYNKLASGDLKLKLSISHTGKKQSQETVQKRIDTRRKNLELGITKPLIHSEETKRKISVSKSGENCSEETRMRLSLSKSGSNHPNYGKPLSMETKQKISTSQTGEKSHNYGRTGDKHTCSKIVHQYSKDGEYIKSFHGISETERQLRIKNISGCCLGKQKSAGGFIWKYAD